MEEKIKKNTKPKKSTTTVEKKKIDKKPTKKIEEKKEKKPVKKVAPKTKPVKKIEEAKSTLNSKIITEDFEEERKRKYNNVVVMLILFVLAIVFLIFLTNKTFFRNSYQNGNLKIKLPLFVYFISDEDNVLTFKTLRKSEYIKKYFDEYLENLEEYDFYNCNGKTIYYNEDTQIAIYGIDVKKDLAIKTITINYGTKQPDKICE